MTEQELNQLGLLEEFSITELEQRLEFEAWCDSNCECEPTNSSSCPINTTCTPIDYECGGGGGGDPLPDEPCIIEPPEY